MAPKCAGVIHIDFERGFIRPEVDTIPELWEHGNTVNLRSADELQEEGKADEVQDGDVMHFRFNM